MGSASKSVNKIIVLLLCMVLALSLLTGCKEKYQPGTQKETSKQVQETENAATITQSESDDESGSADEISQSEEEVEPEELAESEDDDDSFSEAVDTTLSFREFPDFLGKTKIVVGEKAPSLDVITATLLQTTLYAEGYTVETILSKEVGSTNADLIVIGVPCINPMVNTALKISSSQCDIFEPNTAEITLVPQDGREIIILTGYSSENIKKAVDILVNHEENLLLGKHMKISTAGSKPSIDSYS